jgi:hypothetical protein
VSNNFQSLFLGCPPAIREPEGNVPHEFLDIFEEVEEWKPYIDPIAPLQGDVSLRYIERPAYATSTFQCLLQVSKIATKIIDAFYSVRSSSMTRDELLQTRREVIDQLDDWRNTLPAWLRFEPGVDPTPPPHQFTPQ